MSSAGSLDGEFAAAFTHRKQFFSSHRITSYDCPHLTDEWIQGMIDKWGRNHPLVRSMIFSEFSDTGGIDYVIPKSHWLSCVEQRDSIPHKPTQLLAFIDWAAGGDENVISVVSGNKVEHVLAWTESDTMSAAGKAAAELKRLGVPNSRIFADDGGLGRPINDYLQQCGFSVRRVLNNSPSGQPNHFANFGAELWFTASRLIEKQEVILPDDDILMEQATNRRTVYTAAGKLALEKKKDMRDRGVTSPDRADAVLASLALASVMGATSEMFLDNALDGNGTLSDSQIAAIENEQSGWFAGL